jgi:hypothetical protein
VGSVMPMASMIPFVNETNIRMIMKFSRDASNHSRLPQF